MSDTVPIIVTSAGLQQQSPASLLTQLIGIVSAQVPGYTANLPGSLIEDISSTDVAAISLCDSALVDLGNSITPYGANEALLYQLGNVYGVPPGQDVNTSVYCVFSGPPGFVINVGFVVSDGQYQYVVQDGGIIQTSGQSLPLYCLANVPGTWAIPAGTVVNLVTSVPAGISLSVTNPNTGTPASSTQTIGQYRASVLQAGQAVAQGMPTLLKTLLGNIPGVQARLVSIRQQGTSWEIICGGGDPYLVGSAIFQALFDVSNLTGSQILVTGITNANPGVVTTNLYHGYVNGDVVYISGVTGMAGINGVPFTVTVISPTSFSIGVDTTSLGAWVSGGVVTPNNRNVSVSINDYPDTYVIPFVNPPQETVLVDLTWNSISANFVSPTAVATLGNPAIVSYINSIPVGQPINVFELQNAFTNAIASIIAAPLLSRMVFAVTINGIVVTPEAGTGLIYGDAESYFLTNTGQVTIVQG